MNASFSVSQKVLESALLNGTPIKSSDLREVRKHQLGDLDGCGLGFSDAAPLPDGRILFLAAHSAIWTDQQACRAEALRCAAQIAAEMKMPKLAERYSSPLVSK